MLWAVLPFLLPSSSPTGGRGAGCHCRLGTTTQVGGRWAAGGQQQPRSRPRGACRKSSLYLLIPLCLCFEYCILLDLLCTKANEFFDQTSSHCRSIAASSHCRRIALSQHTFDEIVLGSEPLCTSDHILTDARIFEFAVSLILNVLAKFLHLIYVL